MASSKEQQATFPQTAVTIVMASRGPWHRMRHYVAVALCINSLARCQQLSLFSTTFVVTFVTFVSPRYVRYVIGGPYMKY